MFKNYLKVVIRNILKYKLYPIINILGLVLGLTIFIIIGLYTVDELSYDRFYKNSDKIYRVLDFYEKDGIGEKASTTPFPLAKAICNFFPENVESSVRFFNFQLPHIFLQYENIAFYEDKFYFADSTVFDIFDYNFLYGDEFALDSTNSLIITESVMKKYFDNENPLGKEIIYEEGVKLKIKAVIKDVPSQTHFKFNFLASMSTLRNIIGREPQNWVWNPCWTYILLKDSKYAEDIEKQFPELVKKYFKEDYRNKITLSLQKITDIHLKSFYDYEIENNSNIAYIYILLSMIIFILLISIINFTNLATAGSLTRAKEVAIKKIMGANRVVIILQFLFEAIVFSLIALLISVSIVELLIPVFNNFTNKNINLNIIFEAEYLNVLLLIGIFSGFIAGLYPAIIISALKPSEILKQNQTKDIGGKLSRNILVITQFVISIVLIICTLVSLLQFTFYGNADLGFEKENVLIVPVCNTSIAEEYDTFKKEILQIKGVKSATGTTDMLGVSHNTIEFYSNDFGKEIRQAFPGTFVGYDFVETFEIKVLAGRDFSRIIPNDNMNGVLINESLAKHLGCENYQDVIGKRFSSFRYEEKIIGVIKDFNISSLHHKITPFVVQMPKDLFQTDWFINYLAIKIEKDNQLEIIKSIEKKWNELSLVRPFTYTFLSEELNNQYQYEYILVLISIILSVIAVIIASLGVLGLTSFVTEQRTKEIGIRKILGASPLEIIKILLLNFIKMILFSILLAFPFSYFLLDEWLTNFVYPIELKMWMFLAGAFITLILIFIIVPYQAIRAAYKNPVDALRYE